MSLSDIADETFGTGILTDAQRAEKRRWIDSNNYFAFWSRRDLSGEILIIPLRAFTIKHLLLAQGEFVGNFMLWTYKRLNGFAGFDTLEWKLQDGGNLMRQI